MKNIRLSGSQSVVLVATAIRKTAYLALTIFEQDWVTDRYSTLTLVQIFEQRREMSERSEVVVSQHHEVTQRPAHGIISYLPCLAQSISALVFTKHKHDARTAIVS